jgi:hypothetical protein
MERIGTKETRKRLDTKIDQERIERTQNENKKQKT